jgi:D-glycero-D-manno-heptose 1,7-bisphosphate phosphatase
MLRPALFLDRDGVVIREVDLLTRTGQVMLLEGVPEAIERAQRAGWAVVVVSNQTVVARGLCSEADVREIHREIEDRLVEAGCRALDGWYFCPHHPDADVPAYRDTCACRKPRPGMLEQAAKALGLDLEVSVMIGDRLSDIAAGRAAGCETILVRCGAHAAPPIVGMESSDIVRPTFECRDLAAAVAALASPDGEGS